VIWIVLATATQGACSAVNTGGACELPPLTEAEVREVAQEFLQKQNLNPKFRETAETRVTEFGCSYEYEEAEKLDSFGVGVVVEIDRRRRVVDFRGSH
jgi:hypothetical protein